MSRLTIVEREMTDDEFERANLTFGEHSVEFGNPVDVAERFGVVVLDDERFVGCASGLAYRNGTDGAYCRWFYLSDLLIEKAYRGRGLGAAALHRLESRVAGLGIAVIWTWTAGYDGQGFYVRHGYTVFGEQEDFYPSGHSRVAMRKRLS